MNSSGSHSCFVRQSLLLLCMLLQFQCRIHLWNILHEKHFKFPPSTLTRRLLLMLWVRDLFLPSNHNHMKVETWIGALDGNGDDTRRPWRFYLWWVTVVWLGHLLQGYLDHLFSYQTVNCANPSTRSQPNNWRTNGEPCIWCYDKKEGVQSFKKLKRGVQ